MELDQSRSNAARRPSRLIFSNITPPRRLPDGYGKREQRLLLIEIPPAVFTFTLLASPVLLGGTTVRVEHERGRYGDASGPLGRG